MRNNISGFNSLIAKSKVLAIAGVLTIDEILGLGKSEIQGMDWNLSSTAVINLKVEIFQSNDQKGPFVLWSSPTLVGSAVSNIVTISTTIDGTNLRLAPSAFAQIKLTNLGAAALTINRLTIFNQ